MEKGEIAGAIIGILFLIVFFGSIIYSSIKNDEEKRTRNETMINLIIENEKLKYQINNT